MDEIVTLVRYRLGHGAAVTLGDGDQSFSLTDCTSFATMRAREITEAFTFDRTDFETAGFTVVPGRGDLPPRRSARGAARGAGRCTAPRATPPRVPTRPNLGARVTHKYKKSIGNSGPPLRARTPSVK